MTVKKRTGNTSRGGSATSTPQKQHRETTSRTRLVEDYKKHSKVEVKKDSKLYNFAVRTIWTFVMIAGFFIILASGHFWCVVLILGCQIATFKECIAVTGQSGREKNLPLTKTLNWYFLFTTIYYLDGKSLFKFFNDTFVKYTVLNFVASNHKFISYCLYVLGFVIFVCSLRKGYLKFQFASLCVTHMVLLLSLIHIFASKGFT